MIIAHQSLMTQSELVRRTFFAKHFKLPSVLAAAEQHFPPQNCNICLLTRKQRMGPECRVQHYCFTCCFFFFFFLNRAKNKGSSHIRLDDETAVYITSQTQRRLPVLPGETDRDVRLGGDATSNLHRDKRSMTGLTDRQDEEMQLLGSDPHTAPDGVLT